LPVDNTDQNRLVTMMMLAMRSAVDTRIKSPPFYGIV
jgi:hypothetical protein